MHMVLQPLGIPVVAWLGVSYLLFRLLHVLLDSRRNPLPDLKLGELIVYALFPASFIAGRSIASRVSSLISIKSISRLSSTSPPTARG